MKLLFMSEASFNIGTKLQSVKITPTNINGSNDNLNAYLIVPIQFILRPEKEGYGFDIPSISTKLKLQSTGQFLSETFLQTDMSVGRNGTDRTFSPLFLLNENALQHIEKSRSGDLLFSVEITIQSYLKYIPDVGNGVKFYVPTSIQVDKIQILVNIPRSEWIDKLLPSLGYRNLRLIELPIFHPNITEAYEGIIKEFNLAEKYFNTHDYNKCVGHCRNAMDKLTNSLKAIKEQTKSKTAYNWLKDVNSETMTWIDNVNRATSTITSKSHHAGQDVDFKRYEAESIYMVVLGILHYIGNNGK
ncbi:hypothetical protein KXQ82_02085 [Mucilaginibacter sp. HMF5004]|uniref:hypothetical protein n=1 Tax=Mucilaginibacter rivuli TaxID=2857527 RepID=UPI001C5FFD95|nr:hypothetical protein [Mucilaginibacter rivuli]MBW4888480.1 hypothetical protein [Mucilaginibacter rivuli]